jgi:hypothetical protein
MIKSTLTFALESESGTSMTKTKKEDKIKTSSSQEKLDLKYRSLGQESYRPQAGKHLRISTLDHNSTVIDEHSITKLPTLRTSTPTDNKTNQY